MRQIIPPTLLLALSALFSRMLGVWRDHLLATTFGATSGQGIYNLDAYYAAFRIPDLIYNLLIFGVISSAFIPIFTRYKKEGKMDEAWKFANNILHIMLALILIASVLAYILAPWLTGAVAGGFMTEEYELTVRLMRIMLLSPILFTFSAVFISVQDSFRSFFFRSLAPLFYNVGIIGGIIYFGQEFGVVGVTWGVIAGAALQSIVQLPAMIGLGYRYMPILDTRRQDVQKAMSLMLPRVLGLSLTQMTLLVNTLIASFLATGSITVFYLADNLQALPLGIIGISFAITSFATLSELATEKSPKAFANEIRQVAHKVLFLIIPASFGMLLLRHELVDFILVGGKFSAADARATSDVLGFMLLSLFAQSLIPLFSRGFFAFQNTRIPVYSALAGSVVSIGGAVLLALNFDFGVAGIAAAYSAGMVLNFLLLYLLMSRRCGQHLLIWADILKMVLSGALMFGFTLWVRTLVPYGGGFLQKTLSLSVLVGTGILVYFILAILLKIPERNLLARHSAPYAARLK